MDSHLRIITLWSFKHTNIQTDQANIKPLCIHLMYTVFYWEDHFHWRELSSRGETMLDSDKLF